MVKEWKLEVPFPFVNYAVWSQDNLLAIVEVDAVCVLTSFPVTSGWDDLTLRRFVIRINVRLFSLLDGSPHEIPLKKVLPLHLMDSRGARVLDLQISGSRLALAIDVSSSTMKRNHKELIAWDWRTGKVVSDIHS